MVKRDVSFVSGDGCNIIAWHQKDKHVKDNGPWPKKLSNIVGFGG